MTHPPFALAVAALNTTAAFVVLASLVIGWGWWVALGAALLAANVACVAYVLGKLA